MLRDKTLDRRAALLLSASGGVALAGDALAADSTKIGVHQEPGNCATSRSAVAQTHTPQAQALAKTMATAWASFAATGNPGGGWLPSDTQRMQTMIFDNKVRMADDPQGDVRRIIQS